MLRRLNFPPIVLAIATAAVLVRVFFWHYANRTWEDALITVLHAENFMDGLGLTHYKPDEAPVHGFTSPLSVLIPLLGELVHRGLGLPLLKIVSALAGGLTVLFGWKLTRAYGELNLSTGSFLMIATLLAFEHHQILWGMGGMETQMAVLVLIASMWSLRAASPTVQGVLLALCVYVRPDFAIWAAIATVDLFLQARRNGSYKALIRAVTVAVVVYAPWVVFTQLYYGSPIPNTIPAKSNFYDLW